MQVWYRLDKYIIKNKQTWVWRGLGSMNTSRHYCFLHGEERAGLVVDSFLI